MKRTPSYKVLILRPDGLWYEAHVPIFFDVSEVQKKAPHSAVVLVLKKGLQVFTQSQGRVEGPGHVIWNRDDNEFAIIVPDVTKMSDRDVYMYAFGSL